MCRAVNALYCDKILLGHELQYGLGHWIGFWLGYWLGFAAI